MSLSSLVAAGISHNLGSTCWSFLIRFVRRISHLISTTYDTNRREARDRVYMCIKEMMSEVVQVARDDFFVRLAARFGRSAY